MTHSKPISFRTKNKCIDLGETGLKLEWIRSAGLPFFPMIQRRANDHNANYFGFKSFGFEIQWENGDLYRFETGIKYNEKHPFSYLLSSDGQTLYIQLFFEHQGALRIFRCYRIFGGDEATFYTVNKSVTINVDSMTSDPQQSSCTKYESSQLVFCGTKNQYIMSLSNFQDPFQRDRIKAIHVFDFEVKQQVQTVYRHFKLCGVDEQAVADSNTFSMLFRNARRTMPWFLMNQQSQFLFSTQWDKSGHCKLQIHWNYDYSSVRREEALCHYFEGMSEFVFLVLSFVSEPRNVIENCYTVDLPHEPTQIWFEGTDQIGVCHNFEECHYYRIVEDPTCTAI